MQQLLFHFEREKVPPIIVLTTVALFGIFAVGILYQVVAGLLF